MKKEITVFVTVDSVEQTKRISMALLKNKYAACVNIIPAVKSFYWWKGKIENSKEFLMLIKSTKKDLDNIIECVKTNHEYTVPEIIAMPIIGGNPDYLKWVADSTCKKRSTRKI